MVRLEYSLEYVQILLSMVVLLMILYFLSVRKLRQRVLRFGNFETLEKVAGDSVSKVSVIPLLLRVLVITSVVLLASDVKVVQVKPVTHTDFILAIDTSSSMLTPDFTPNRLAATKEAALGWINSIEGGRVGVVTFSGKAYVKIKPTRDKDVLNTIIGAIRPESPAGTAIGDALITSSSLLTGSKANKTIIMITDGRNNVGVSINDSIKALIRSDIRVYSIGVGTEGIEAKTEVPLVLEGKNLTSPEFPGLDENMLRYLANVTNGSYSLVDEVSELKESLASAADIDEVSFSPKKYLLFLVMGLLLIEWALEISKYRPVP